MLNELAPELRKLDQSKAGILRLLQAWPVGTLTRQPSPEAWSAAQVIDHIARVEEGILKRVRENLTQPHPLTRDDRIGSFIVRCVMRAPVKVKTPESAPQILPANDVSAPEALESWAVARERWRSLLETLPSIPKQGVFSHPRGGWFTLPQTLLFLRLHHNHHKPQLRRIGSIVRHQG